MTSHHDWKHALGEDHGLRKHDVSESHGKAKDFLFTESAALKKVFEIIDNNIIIKQSQRGQS